jgi:hypothetical protein
MTDPTAAIEVWARMLCAADVHVHGADHPTWQQLVGETGSRIRDDYRKAAAWLLPRLTVAAAPAGPAPATNRAAAAAWAEKAASAPTPYDDGFREGQRSRDREVDLLRAELSAARSAAVLPATEGDTLAAVRALHQPMERGPFTICAHCSGWDGKWRCRGVVTDYPCPTVRALDDPPAREAQQDPTQDGEFVPPVAMGLPAGTLEAAEIGANRLDAWARTPNGRNFLAHALVQLARTGWLRTEPGEGFEPVRDRDDIPEPQQPAAVARSGQPDTEA